MTDTATRTLSNGVRDEITHAVKSGARLEEIEERVIEYAPLDGEARDAMWLYAWAALERRQVGTWRRSWN